MTLDEWRDRIAELRELAESTLESDRRSRYLDLANRWEEFAEQMATGTVPASEDEVSA